MALAPSSPIPFPPQQPKRQAVCMMLFVRSSGWRQVSAYGQSREPVIPWLERGKVGPWPSECKRRGGYCAESTHLYPELLKARHIPPGSLVPYSSPTPKSPCLFQATSPTRDSPNSSRQPLHLTHSHERIITLATEMPLINPGTCKLLFLSLSLSIYKSTEKGWPT